MAKQQDYQSPPESIKLARETMRAVKEALTRDANGTFPPGNDELWYGMNMQPPEMAWQDMDAGQRYDLLLHALDETVWSLRPAEKWDDWRDSQKLALAFVKEDDPAGYARFIRNENRSNPAAIADDRDDMPSSEEWRKLKAEWSHDYGLRRLEDRGVRYEDEAERGLDDAGPGRAGEQHRDRPDSITAAILADPKAFLNSQQKQPGLDQGKSSGNAKANGHEGGHSM